MNFFSLFSTFIITSISLLALRPVASRVGLIDEPGGRKTHILPTPLVGGLGIYLGTLFITFFSPAILEQYGAMLALSAFVLLVGITDDLKELMAFVRIGLHILAALLMATVADVRLESFGNILGTGPVVLGAMAVPVTVFATVGVINAINMSDGLDGLSGGLVLIALMFLALMSLGAGNLNLLNFTIILGCAVAAFLMMNFRLLWKKNALIYLGDAGSTMLGFMLAWLLISNSQGSNATFPPVYALWLLAIPLMDTVYLLFQRPLRHLSPFKPGMDHIHHNLMRQGLSIRSTVLLLYTAALMFGAIGFIGYALDVSETFMFLAFVVIFLFYIHVSQVLGKQVS